MGHSFIRLLDFHSSLQAWMNKQNSDDLTGSIELDEVEHNRFDAADEEDEDDSGEVGDEIGLNMNKACLRPGLKSQSWTSQ